MSIKSIDPTNGKVIKSYPETTKAQVVKKIEQGHKAWTEWRKSSIKERAALLRGLADQLHIQRAELARLMALEMGKPLNDGLAEIDKCGAVCKYYAEKGADFLQDQRIETEASKSYVSFQPLGVVLAVMPWNFPYWQVFRFLAPALMAGNCGVLKHASNVPGCALSIEKLVKDAGYPAHVFQTLMIGSNVVNEVIAHPLIKAVTLTGSTQAGMKVAAQAGMLLKKTVLELGGSDPYLVLEDADLEFAAETCVNSRLINNGQSCIAAKRFIVVKKIEKEFTRLFVQKMKQKKLGNPLEADINLGPMARADLRDELHQQVLKNIEMGAKCLLGGRIPAFKGQHAYYEPTVLSGIKKGMPAYSEEMFGPVAAILTARDVEQAIELANDTSFGLGAAVFTANEKLGEEIARTRLQAGSCFVNSLVKSDPRLPFGGINQSGYGRELGLFGIHEFVNIKTVYVK
ncbi:NAD-dependent succinate-semialdehyde dehydrogenase [Pedobacter heparinus]|uniref:Aldehyde Dehydrogenase n=1 Tax=Pedobacter heparinus (strain ATCC 13125 / DSM 2366 / CIP 104194 / JCM 7457 / NBRC 12017 / NCIMB 9290 / NRRL B-14731 / HIM 762-3) TaxID=485917 RepID=C6XX11_PEDHD|nr:NAD-dependent succinate-semialdehyde dehydrogenase [Pedobacter heparinus]ACU04305.1 Aldehyde Dehydrogenase [Pedobacter heparinus DSM 2366]